MADPSAKKHLLKMSVSCISLLSIVVAGFFLFWREWSAVKNFMGSMDLLSFRNVGIFLSFPFITTITFLISVGVSGSDEISSQVIIPGVVISVFLQFTSIMAAKAWAWSPYALAGTFFLVQSWSGYLTGWIQRDVDEGRVRNSSLNIVSEFWLLIPLVLSGWVISWGCHAALFGS